jgi:hypothetical protein
MVHENESQKTCQSDTTNKTTVGTYQCLTIHPSEECGLCTHPIYCYEYKYIRKRENKIKMHRTYEYASTTIVEVFQGCLYARTLTK